MLTDLLAILTPLEKFFAAKASYPHALKLPVPQHFSKDDPPVVGRLFFKMGYFFESLLLMSSLSAFLSTFPTFVVGSSSTNSILSGNCCTEAPCSFRKETTSENVRYTSPWSAT